MTKEETNWEEEFVEKGADLEHIRWSKWQEHFFSKCKTGRIDEEDKDVVLILPRDLYDRWWRQINTIYSELSEAEKESDRREVRQYLPLISKLISQEREKWVGEIKKGLLNCPKTDWGDTDEETPDSWEEGYEQCLQDTLDFVNNLLQKQ